MLQRLAFLRSPRTLGLVWLVIALGLLLHDLSLYVSFAPLALTLSPASTPTPLGDDFINTWSGPSLFFEGRPEDIYSLDGYDFYRDHMRELTQNLGLKSYNYSYPPNHLLLTLPLAFFKYPAALLLWTLGGIWAFAKAVRATCPPASPLFLVLALPVTVFVIIGGQNGLFTAALMGGGLALLRKRPIAAGLLFALLSAKPQLGILIPFALLAGRHYRAFFAALGGTLFLMAASFVLLVPGLWNDYFIHCRDMRLYILEPHRGAWYYFVSVYKAANNLGAEIETAYRVQAVAAIAALGATLALWRSQASDAAKGAGLILATFLATPYAQYYDMPMLLFPVLALEQAEATPRARRIAQALLCAAPLLSVWIAQKTESLTLAPLMLLPACWILFRAPLRDFALDIRHRFA